MTSDFVPEVAKYPKSSPKHMNNFGSVWAYCFAPLTMQLVFRRDWYLVINCNTLFHFMAHLWDNPWRSIMTSEISLF